MDSEILKDVWPPVPKHIETKVAELEAEVATLEGRSAADHMKYQSHLETKVVKLEAEVAARDKRLNSWRDEIRMCHGEDCECRICGDEPLAALLEGKQGG